MDASEGLDAAARNADAAEPQVAWYPEILRRAAAAGADAITRTIARVQARRPMPPI